MITKCAKRYYYKDGTGLLAQGIYELPRAPASKRVYLRNHSHETEFDSYLVLRCQNESSCDAIHMKMCSAHMFIFMQT